jgi:hypothetical protein
MSLLAFPSDASGKARPTPQAQIVLSGSIVVPYGIGMSDAHSSGRSVHIDEIAGGFKPGQPVFRNVKHNELSEAGVPIYYCDWRNIKDDKERPHIADVSLVGLAQGDSPEPAMRGTTVLQDSTINRSGTFLIPRNRGSHNLKPFDEVYAIPRINGFPADLFTNESEEIRTFVIVPHHELKNTISKMGRFSGSDLVAVAADVEAGGGSVFVFKAGRKATLTSPARHAFDEYTEMGMYALGMAFLGEGKGAGGSTPYCASPNFARGAMVAADDTTIIRKGADLAMSNRAVIEVLLKPLETFLGDPSSPDGTVWTLTPLEIILAYLQAYEAARNQIYGYYLGTMVDAAGRNEHVHVDLRIGYKPVHSVV